MQAASPRWRRMMAIRSIWLAAAVLLAGGGCTSKYVIPPDGAYDYRVPVASGGANEAFEGLMNATLKIVWSPRYRTFHYTHDLMSDTGVRLDRPLSDSSSPTGYRLQEEDGIQVTEDTYSKVGAGLLIVRTAVGEQSDAAVAVTVAHLVTAPDTLRVYVRDRLGRETDILESLSVKQDEFLFATGPDGANLEATIRKLDPERDLALLTLSIPWQYKSLHGCQLRLGDVQDLQWGNYIYVVGYPRGRLRLTGGIVSLDPQKGRFNVDAPVRAGYSGGAVVAVRDGLPNLELVGLCQGVTTHMVRTLVPDPSLLPGAALSSGVLDRVVVEEEERVDYGLGFAVGIDEVKAFLVENRGVLTKKGINVDNNALLRMWGF